MNWNVKRFSVWNISQGILMRTDSNLCRKELIVHWSSPNSLIRSYLQPCTNSMWGDESEAVAPIIWLFQIVDAQKEEVFFPDLLITVRSYVSFKEMWFQIVTIYFILCNAFSGSFWKHVALTHWGRDKMAAISQTMFSNAFSWMKMHELWLRFHWGLFLRVQLTIFKHWFR